MSNRTKIIIGVTLGIVVVGGIVAFVGYRKGWFAKK